MSNSSNVNWWLDCTEILSYTADLADPPTMVENTFYIGPFPYTPGQTITIQQFMEDINLKFFNVSAGIEADIASGPSPANNHGRTMNLYEVSAKVIVANSDQVSYLQGPGSPMAIFRDLTNQTNTNQDFVIEYTLAPAADGYAASTAYDFESISIRAWDGLHGANHPAIDATPGQTGIPGEGTTADAEVPYATVGYTNASNTVFYEVPSTSTQAVMLDSPPLPPNLVIAPYQGINNRLMLMLNSNTGEYLTRPEIIKASDANAIADLYLFQNNTAVAPNDIADMLDDPVNPLKLRYRNDDPIKKYEIFRLESRPSKYSDFGSAGVHAYAESTVFVNKGSSAASFIDSVSPNTKYYYCVRALDVHNNFSNPTHIFEAELVDNDGQVYLILKTISLTSEKRKIYNKSGKRYLYIEPAIRNLTVDKSIIQADYGNATVETFPGQDILGIPEVVAAGEATGPDVWNKTFKIRLTSKESNKKIDLNITFKNTGVDYP